MQLIDQASFGIDAFDSGAFIPPYLKYYSLIAG